MNYNKYLVYNYVNYLYLRKLNIVLYIRLVLVVKRFKLVATQ